MKRIEGNNKIIRITSIILLFVFLFSGCKSEITNKSYRKVNVKPIESFIAAENSEYQLLWDSKASAVLLKSLDTEKIYSNILYNAYIEGSGSANANSSLLMNIINTKTFKTEEVRSYSEIPENGSIALKRIKNGIRITYFFDKYKIAVPVDYELKDKSLSVSVNTATILESGTEYKLLSLSLAPYMCSVKNEAADGCLFVPSGCGALMYTKETPEGVKKYSAEVYGRDAVKQIARDVLTDEKIHIPVFGASCDDFGMFAIIEKGAGAAEITAQAGNTKTSYSNIYSNFFVRGLDEFLYKKLDGNAKKLTQRINKNISNQILSIRFYPLDRDKSDYAGMAEMYREYLIDGGLLSKDKTDCSPYSVTFLGGTQRTESVLGIPNKKTVALTDFVTCGEIIDDLYNKNGIAPEVRLSGFGDRGIFPGKIAGGNKYSSVYGTNKELKALQKLCDTIKTNLFFDSEIVFFSDSGCGFSKYTDSAFSAIKKRITHYSLSPIKIQDKSNDYTVISRGKLKDASATALKKSQKYGNKAVCLSSIGNTAFSDYKYSEYYTKKKIESDVTDIIKSFKKEKILTAVASANSYAACAADTIFDVSVSNGNYNVFDEEVPFYQMVFHGYKNMYTEGINLSAVPKANLATAASFGMGLGYTIIGEYVSDSDELGNYKLYGMLYEDNRDLISATLCKSGYAEIFESVKDAEILKYSILEGGITKTEYSNGKTVFVNHSDRKSSYPSGTLDSYEIVME